jgi:hypothetical protein
LAYQSAYIKERLGIAARSLLKWALLNSVGAKEMSAVGEKESDDDIRYYKIKRRPVSHV